MKQHDYSIANLKALMLLCIFLNHAFAATSYIHTKQIIDADNFNYFCGSLTLCLGAFFMLSGYFIPCSGGENWSGYCQMLNRRCRTLLLPFFTWNFIYIMFYVIGGIFVSSLRIKVQSLGYHSFFGILDGMIGITQNPADGPLWYIRSLFLCILLYPLLFRLCKLPFYIAMAVIMLFGLVEGFLYQYWPSPVLLVHLKPYIIPSFCFGVLFRVHGISLHVFGKHWIVSMLFVLLVYIGGVYHVGNISFLKCLHETRLLYILTIPGWLALVEFLTFPPESLLYKWVTTPSFFIYASHALCGGLLLRILGPLVPDHSFKLIILVTLYFVGGLAIIYTWYLSMKRFTPRVFFILSGGR